MNVDGNKIRFRVPTIVYKMFSPVKGKNVYMKTLILITLQKIINL